MIDLHSHILPGLDDGARALAESVEIARAAVREGIDTICATPHVREDYPTSAEAMERGVAELRRALTDAAVPLEVLPGGEVDLDRLGGLPPDELRRFGLGGNPAYVLVEFPYYGWPLGLGDAVFGLRSSGITPVLAHPERSAEVQEAPDRMRPFVEQGALVQLTASSIAGSGGRRARSAALALLELELAHLLASDAHAPDVRSFHIRDARAAVPDRLGRWLAEEVPDAIVAGDPLPPRPPAGRARPARLPWNRRRGSR
jgi:protein-tyrosine phosphatase